MARREVRPHGGHADPPQAQVSKLGEEMSLRFLKREAKLCGFLQKSFLALEKVGGAGLRPGRAGPPLGRSRQAGAGLPTEDEGFGERPAQGGGQPAGGAGQQVAGAAGAGGGASAGPAGAARGGGRGGGGHPGGGGGVRAGAESRGGGWGPPGEGGGVRARRHLCAPAGRMARAGAVPGPGQGRGGADRVHTAEPAVSEPHPHGRAEGPVGV